MKKFLYSVIVVLLLTTTYQTGKSYAHTNADSPPGFSEYFIVSGKTPGELKTHVDVNLHSGYTPVGGIAVSNGTFYQAVAK